MNVNFSKWVDYFQANKRNLQKIDWNDQYQLNICEQILSDEAKHVEFQSVALNTVSMNRKKTLKVLIKFTRMFLLFGTLVVVWFYHSKVLKAGGYDFIRYIKSALGEFRRSEGLINKI